MRSDAEIIVVGGGLAGCATALHLARWGHDVVILERQTGPGDKVCGEGLMPHGADALSRLGVPPPAAARPFCGIRWTVDGVTALGSFPEGRSGLGLRRRDLDAALQAAAERDPRVEIRRGVAVTSMERTADGVILSTRTGEGAGQLRGRLIIGADGLHSGIRRQAGLDRPSRGRKRYGLRGHARLAPGVPDPPRVEVEMLQGAELYLTPVGPGEVNVAVLCEAEAAKALKGDLAGTLWRWVQPVLGDRLAAPPEEVAACGPLRREASDVVADRLVLVGDAAGFIDGITGEGMSTGLVCAEIAAEVVSSTLRINRLEASALRPYATRRRQLVRDTDLLTELVLWGLPRRWLVKRVVRKLAEHPVLFDRLLAIESGTASFTSYGLGGWWRLVIP